MVVSNEPGYYQEGAFGIRLENLLLVIDDTRPDDGQPMLAFETLTQVPFDERLVIWEMLTAKERDWFEAYQAKTITRA
jgi:Xaa-Pro aminopeptidase